MYTDARVQRIYSGSREIMNEVTSRAQQLDPMPARDKNMMCC